MKQQLSLGVLVASVLLAQAAYKPHDCRADKDCGYHHRCQNRRCVEYNPKCNDDYHCSDGYICKNYYCVTEECGKYRDCSGYQRCQNGRCVDPRPRPRPRPRHKSRPKPRHRCYSDKECGAGYVCLNYNCVEGQCRRDKDCAYGESCHRSRCIADCTPCYRRNRKYGCDYACNTETQYCDGHSCRCNYGLVDRKGACVARKQDRPQRRRHPDPHRGYPDPDPYRGYPDPHRDEANLAAERLRSFTNGLNSGNKG